MLLSSRKAHKTDGLEGIDRLRGNTDLAVNTVRGKTIEVHINTVRALCTGDLVV